MAENHTIIEVKSSNAQLNGIEKDLKTLSLFRTKVNYQRAIYLLFGYEAAVAAKRVRRVAAGLDGLQPIELWLHTMPGESAHQVCIGIDA